MSRAKAYISCSGLVDREMLIKAARILEDHNIVPKFHVKGTPYTTSKLEVADVVFFLPYDPTFLKHRGRINTFNTQVGKGMWDELHFAKENYKSCYMIRGFEANDLILSKITDGDHKMTALDWKRQYGFLNSEDSYGIRDIAPKHYPLEDTQLSLLKDFGMLLI